jgi:hypothetical protein
MRELIVCLKNKEAIDLVLERTRNSAANRTLKSFEQLLFITKEAESRISNWVPFALGRLGARIIHQSEQRLSTADQRKQLQRHGLFVYMERRTRGWVLTNVEWRICVGAYGDCTRILLSPAQDAMARLRFSAQYSVLPNEPRIQTFLQLKSVP